MRVGKATTSMVIILLVVLAGCTTSIKTQVLVPAKAHGAAKLRRIAVLPFGGPTGHEASADVEALLVGLRLNDQPFFTVVERKAMKRILEEHALEMSGAVDAKTAAKLGALLGVEGIVLGTVTQCNAEDAPYTEKRSECIARNEKGKCTQWRDYAVNCVERNAYFSFAPKVVNVTTGEIVASEVLSGRSRDCVCQDSERPLRGRDQMTAEARRGAIQKLRELVAPYYVTVDIKLLKKDDSKMPSEVREKIALGVEWAEKGRLDRACECWDEAYQVHPQGYAIPYLLGVCAEIKGNLDEALGYYEKADRNTGEPVTEISEALGRIRVTMEKQRRLEDQLQK